MSHPPLDDWQKLDVRELLEKPRAILMEPIGAGKTRVCCAYLDALRRANRLHKGVVVAGLTYMPQWEEELEEWGIPFCTRGGMVDGVLLTSPQRVQHVKYDPDVLVYDQITGIKNRDSTLALQVKGVAWRSKRVVGAGDMAFEKNLAELFSVMEFIDPDVLGAFYNFEEKHLIYDRTHRIVGSRYAGEVFEKCEPFIIRNAPDNMDVPEVEIHHWAFDLPAQGRIEYEALEREFSGNRGAYGRNVGYTQMTSLCARYMDPKLEWLVEHAKEGTMMVTSSYRVHIAKMIADEMRGLGRAVGLMTGKTSKSQRRELQKKMWAHEIDMLSMSSVGEKGINLQCAKDIIFFERVPNVERTRETLGRICRRGSLHDTIRIYNLFFRSTVEEYALLKMRRELGLLNQMATQERVELGVDQRLVIKNEDHVWQGQYTTD